jgi:hypothetical protein
MAKDFSKTPADAPPKDHTPPMPKQVRDQMAAAEAMRAEMNGTQPPEDEAPQDGTQPQQEPQPTHPTPQPPQPEPQPQPQPPQEEQSWEQRFNSLRGRYDQAAQTNNALAQRLEQMEQLIATMKVRGAEEATSYAPPPVEPLRLVTPEEAADYGDEFLQVVGKRAKEEFFPEVETLSQRIARLEGQVQGVGTVMERTEQQRVYGTLAAAVPNWREINTDQGFKDWLSVSDPFSGQPRKKLLLDAFARHEGGRVVEFFKGFLAEASDTPPNTQSPGTAAPPLPGNGQGSGRPSLESFAAPGRARSAPQALSPDKPVYTSAQIARFMADKLTGKYRGREADADAIERDIYQAQHEGRIQ